MQLHIQQRALLDRASKEKTTRIMPWSKGGELLKLTAVFPQLFQLVWADTTHVGCGVSKCNFRGYNSIYVVCNYGPG